MQSPEWRQHQGDWLSCKDSPKKHNLCIWHLVVRRPIMRAIMGDCSVDLALFTFLLVPVVFLYCLVFLIFWLPRPTRQWPTKNVALYWCVAVVTGVVAYLLVYWLCESLFTMVQCSQYDDLMGVLGFYMVVVVFLCCCCRGVGDSSSAETKQEKPPLESDGWTTAELWLLLVGGSLFAVGLRPQQTVHEVQQLIFYYYMESPLACLLGCCWGCYHGSSTSSSVSTAKQEKQDPGRDTSTAAGANAQEEESESVELGTLHPDTAAGNNGSV